MPRVIHTETVRQVIIDEGAYVLCLEHRDAYKRAEADLASTPWWRVTRRMRLSRDYVRHLRLCVDYQHKGMRFEVVAA